MTKEFWVHLFHILIVGSLFLYVGINRTSIPKLMYPILLYLGIIIVLYHMYKVYSYIQAGKPYWVNLIHIFIVGPTLILIGYNDDKTHRKLFEILMMLGFASIGYHGYYMFQG
jgi:Na+-transporting methylmalonyl-CoA/oxaloacetate decarboxylase beta subunit